MGPAAQAAGHGAARGRGPQPPPRAPRGRDRVAARAARPDGGQHDGHAPQPARVRGGRAAAGTTCRCRSRPTAATRSRRSSGCCAPSCGRRARSRCTATATPTSWPRCARRTCTSTAASSRPRACARPPHAGLTVTAESCLLLGVDYEALTPTSSASVAGGGHRLRPVLGHLAGARAAEHQRRVQAGRAGRGHVGVQPVAHHQRAALAEPVQRGQHQLGLGLADDRRRLPRADLDRGQQGPGAGPRALGHRQRGVAGGAQQVAAVARGQGRVAQHRRSRSRRCRRPGRPRPRPRAACR